MFRIKTSKCLEHNHRIYYLLQLVCYNYLCRCLSPILTITSKHIWTKRGLIFLFCLCRSNLISFDQEFWGWGCCPSEPGSQGCHPSGLRRQRITKTKWIILEPYNWTEFPLLGFRLAWNLWSLSAFWLLHFGMGMSILCLVHRFYLEAGNMSGFTGSQLERNIASRWIILRISTMAD